ncbi:hypothetical protein C7Y72_02535 [Paraconexibacter algicola]|uniref:Uncharacterized protein n=1 Tax=Paraconexibacter algicola TaxID=2133960 RepID=A0A2T4UH95_9ACTN|nr:hypothetical protein C7Y72_02535 [Paraconexibacter algicola]
MRTVRCYDGCGQEVRGLGLRAANRQGERATVVMERLQNARDRTLDARQGGARTGAALERLAHHEVQLRQVLTSCHEVLHGERSYKEIDWKLVRTTITEADRFVTLLRRRP